MIASLDAIHKYAAEHPLPPPFVLHRLHLFFLKPATAPTDPVGRSLCAIHTLPFPGLQDFSVALLSSFSLFPRFSSPCHKSAWSNLDHAGRRSPGCCVENETWRVGVRGIVAARIKGGGGLLYKCVGGAIRAVLCCAGWLLAKHSSLYSIFIDVLIRVDFAGIRG
jgi:hypothetical protein